MKISLKLVVLVCVSLLCSGCQKSSSSKKKSTNQGRYLHLGITAGIRSLEPYIATDYPSAYFTKMLLEGLLITGHGEQILPGMAKSYEVSEDKKHYTFFLRPAKWSNGEEVTAYDFEYSWKKIINPETSSIAAHNFYCILNAREAYLGKKPLDSVGIKAIDSKTLRIDLEHPTHYFEQLVSSPSFLPVNARVDKENSNWANGNNYVSNGPYLLEKYSLEHEMVVRKNPNYWDAQQVTMPGISVVIIKDPVTLINLYDKGKIDWLGNPLFRIPVDAQMHLRNKMYCTKSLGVFWLFLNTNVYPFHNKKIRKSLSYALNREQIVKHVTGGSEVPATGILPYHLSAQKEPFFKDNDQHLAKQLFKEGLEELGIKKEDLPDFIFIHSTNPSHTILAQAIQDQWREVLDIRVRLERAEFGSHISRLQKGNFHIGAMTYQSWLRDPIYIMQTFLDLSGWNLSFWINKDFQNYLAEAEEEIRPEKRMEYFHKAERVLIEEMPVIPIFFTTLHFMKNEKLKNVYTSDLYELDFRWSFFKD